MSDRWFGWCARDERETLEWALHTHDGDATLVVVDSASELRRRVQSSEGPVGAVVGLVSEGVSAINVAAALVRDGSAREVVLVTRAATQDLRNRAGKAGIGLVLEAPATLETERTPSPVRGMRHGIDAWGKAATSAIFDLDEPIELVGDSPTLVMLPSPVLDTRVPDVEKGHATRTEREGEREIVPPWEDGPGREERRAPVITFVSGRGGVGKTSLVAMMAHVASSWGMRVALLDLDLSAGNLYGCLGLPGPADLAVLAECDEPTREDVLSCRREAGQGKALWGGCELPEMAELVMPKIGLVIATLAQEYDLVLVDTSVALTDAVAQAAQACDRLVIVVDGRPGSSAAQRRMGALAVRLGVARTRMVRLANRCGLRGKGEPEINRADVGLETARPLRVFSGGLEVAECLGEGKPQELMDLASRFASSCASSLATLLSELGHLPQNEEARQAFEMRNERPRWTFGHRKGAV